MLSMQKFWLPDDKILASHLLINEDIWFGMNQNLLLAMANTSVGRDLLCIPKEYPRIVKMTKNSVHCLVNVKGDSATILADFRIGAKWANIIRYRWEIFNSYARYFIANSKIGVGVSPLTLSARSVFALTLTSYPDPNPETTTFDAIVYVNGQNTSFSSIRGVSSSTTYTADTAEKMVGYSCSSTSPNFRDLYRSIFLYDTSSLTSGATVSSATQSIYGFGALNNLGGSPNINVYSATPASNTVLTAGDNQQISSTAYCDTAVVYGSWSTVAYNDFVYNATGIAGVSLTGVTKTGARNADHDVANSNPGYNSLKTDYLQGYFADNTGTANDPKLVVTYTLPVIFLKTMNLRQAIPRSYSY